VPINCGTRAPILPVAFLKQVAATYPRRQVKSADVVY
jgi:hypothetical protein